MKLSEGLMLASVLPLCRGRFVSYEYKESGHFYSGCLLTNLAAVSGILKPDFLFMNQEVLDKLKEAFPILEKKIEKKDHFGLDPDGFSAYYIVNDFDNDRSVEDIILWVKELEDQTEIENNEKEIVNVENHDHVPVSV